MESDTGYDTRRRGRWHVASTAARSSAVNGRAWPRPAAVLRYPAKTRAVCSPAGWVHLAGEPKTVDHIHDVLSAILRTAVKWDHLVDNPARGVDLPRLVTVRPKWALTAAQAANLLEALPALPKTLVGLALLTGVRRGSARFRCRLWRRSWRRPGGGKLAGRGPTT